MTFMLGLVLVTKIIKEWTSFMSHSLSIWRTCSSTICTYLLTTVSNYMNLSYHAVLYIYLIVSKSFSPGVLWGFDSQPVLFAVFIFDSDKVNSLTPSHLYISFNTFSYSPSVTSPSFTWDVCTLFRWIVLLSCSQLIVAKWKSFGNCLLVDFCPILMISF